jgi:hypothetical protein
MNTYVTRRATLTAAASALVGGAFKDPNRGAIPIANVVGIYDLTAYLVPGGMNQT